MTGTPFAPAEVLAAAQESVQRLDQTRSFLVAVRPAGEVIEAVAHDRYLHAGPPLGADEPPAPMRGALAAVLVFEGRCATIDAALSLIESGALDLGSANEAGAVGAVAGIVSPSMPTICAGSDSDTASRFSIGCSVIITIRISAEPMITLSVRSMGVRAAAITTPPCR